MISKYLKWTMVILVLVLTLDISASSARAHGESIIRVTSEPIVLGGNITIEGEEFEEHDKITLVLVGLTGEVPLGTVDADAEGSFRFGASLPATVDPGRYQLLARGRETTASADIRVLAGPEGAPAQKHVTGVEFHRGASPGTTIALAVVIALIAVAGLALAFLPSLRRHMPRR